MHIIDGYKENALEATYQLVVEQGAFRTKKTWRDTQFVITDNVGQTEQEVRAEFSFLGTISRDAFLQRIAPKHICSCVHPETGVLADLWEVTLEYDSDFDSEGAQQQPGQIDREDPTNTRPQRRTYSETFEEVIFNDPVTGAPIQTANGEPIIMTHRAYMNILEIVRYEPYPQQFANLFGLKNQFVNHVNAGMFYSMPLGYVMCLDISHDEEIITLLNGNKALFIKATYKFGTKSKFVPAPGGDLEEISGFVLTPLHEGYIVRKKAGGKPELNLDVKSKQPIRVNLASDGTILPQAASPQYLQFFEAPFADFSQLGLEF